MEDFLNGFYGYEKLEDKRSLYHFLTEFEKIKFKLPAKLINSFLNDLVIVYLGEDSQRNNIEKDISKEGINYFNDFILSLIISLQVGGDAIKKKKDLLVKMITIRITQEMKKARVTTSSGFMILSIPLLKIYDLVERTFLIFQWMKFTEL